MRTETEVLVDCLQRLNRSGIAYMLTGSMASNAWGMPRFTHDIDIVVQCITGPSNSKLVTRLGRF